MVRSTNGFLKNGLEKGHHSISYADTYYKLTHLYENDQEKFWDELISPLYFKNLTKNRLEYNIDVRKGDVFIKFLSGSYTNMAYNCLERNIEQGLGSKIAYIWEGNEPCDTKTITYKELSDEVKTFANVLRSKGVTKGDVVAIFLPWVMELPIAILACNRIGAIFSTFYMDLSAKSLAERFDQLKPKVVITLDGFFKGLEFIATKKLVDEAKGLSDHKIKNVIVIDHLKRITISSGSKFYIETDKEYDASWDKEMEKCKNLESPIEWVEAEDPLFVIYSSGSTGRPKGVVHTTAAFMVSTYHSNSAFFDPQPDDICWGTSQSGWLSSISLSVYGALLNGITSVIFEGIPSYPHQGRHLAIIEKYKVSKIFTGTSEIRSMMGWDRSIIKKFDLSSLKIVGIGGEKILPATWDFLNDEIGQGKISVVNGYGQTEMPGVIYLPSFVPSKFASVGKPYYSKVVLLDDDGEKIEGPGEGIVCYEAPYFAMARTIWGDHQRCVDNYFTKYPGFFYSGDQGQRDEDGYYWILGRIDDEIKIRGAKFLSHEIDAVISSHPDIAEAVVVTANYDGKHTKPYAFVIMAHGKTLTDEVLEDIKRRLEEKFSSLVVPDVFQVVEDLPKTSSGKILRRVLIPIAEGNRKADLGDTTSLANPEVIEQLWKTRPII